MNLRPVALPRIPAPFLILPLALAGLGLASQSGAEGGSRSVPLREVPDPPAAQDPAKQAFAPEVWRARIEEPDLDRRLEAYTELLEEARRDRSARAALEGWARDPARPETAWTARLLLRELENEAPSAWPFGQRRPGGGSALRGRDPWAELFGEGLPGQGFRDLHMHFGDPFAEIEQRLRELERSLGGFPVPRAQGQGPPLGIGPGGASPPGSGPRSSGRSVSVEVGPDGVHVRIQTSADGEERTEEYRARSIAELLEQHPELGEHLGQRAPRASAPTAPGRPLLGIGYRPLEDDRAAQLGLERGLGLEVLSVQPGSLAERLGLAVGDVLFELGGRPLRGADDVQAVLGERRSGALLEARAYSPDGSLRELRADTPPSRPRSLEELDTRPF